MPPPAGGKRKRGDRSYSGDSYSRPSPHRPDELSLASSQSQSPSNGRQYFEGRGRGGRRGSRGGRGSSNTTAPTSISAEPDSTVVNSPPPVAEPAPAASSTGLNTMDGTSDDLETLPSEPYTYSYLSDETCESWNEQGRQALVEQATQAIQEMDELKISVIVDEIIQSVLTGRLNSLSGGECVKQILELASSQMEEQNTISEQDVMTIITDAISVIYENSQSVPLAKLSDLVLSAGIPFDFLRHEVDAKLLEKLSLIRQTFERMGIRKQTNVLYRQANFNLMREESEGFAKLVTELFTTSSTEQPSGDAVDDAVEKVKALIGAFDLDVGRSLDVVLDVFGAVLIKQFRFFVKFLRSSPWWPRAASENVTGVQSSGLPLWALPGVEEWYLTDEQKTALTEQKRLRDSKFWTMAETEGLRAFYKLGLASHADGKSATAALEDPFERAWVEQTGTKLPSGNRDAAQLLGFKLRFYSSSPARDENDVLPDNLIFLSALLIKIGFISLKDLYPHIWRTDETMEELRQAKEKEKEEKERSTKGGGVKNALAMAGALADDTVPAIPSRLRESNTRATTPLREADAEKTTTKETSTEPADQKILLLKSLLAIGALPEALFILGRFPWIVDLFPEVPEYIHRILHCSLSYVVDKVQPLLGRPSLSEPKPIYETDLPGVQKGQVKMVEAPERKILRWALLDRNDSTDGTHYRFYWDDWNDNIPICQNVDDVFTLCDTLLPLVGVKIGQDPTLLVKFARIGKASLQQDASQANRLRWLDLLKRILLPAVSLTKSNAGVANEIFELMCNFPVNTRYLLYLEWTSGRVSRSPDVRAATSQAKAETGQILKRISKTNVREMARKLAGVAYANPHIVITSALSQIESYDSIANVFVEGVRYFTDLGYDVLTWGLITALSKQGRDRMQEGGMFASRWLSALSSFAGKVYKRYGMMKPGPILQYVAQQLNRGNSADLKMLEYLTTSMAGIAKDVSYNDSQLQSMGGGPLLQSQTLSQLLDQREKSKSTAKRLIKALLDSGLIGKLALSMAQQRQECVFEDGDVPLKAVANTYDEIHGIMEQYLELLRSSLATSDFAQSVPNILELVNAYELRPELAFWIARPLIAHQIAEHNQLNSISRKLDDSIPEVNGDVEMSDQAHVSSEEDGEATENDNAAAAAGTPSDVAVLEPTIDEGEGQTPLADVDTDDRWHPVLRDIMHGLEPKVPEEILSSIGIGFYVTFWQLSLYDITVPSSSYTDEMARQKREKAKNAADKSDVSLTGVRERQKKAKQIDQLIDDVFAENKQHIKHHQESRARLQREKDVWFIGKARDNVELNTALLEHCFLPRLLLSPLDAYFCFKFVKHLHSSGTPNFRTLSFYDLLLRAGRLTSLIFMCSSKEADNLGRFLHELLKDLARWHAAKSVYEREACGPKKQLPGFSVKVESGRPTAFLEFENFRRILYKWHTQLYQALLKCLTSPEYMHVRNAISVLRTISGTYPQVDWHGTQLQKAVDKLGQSDKEDLKVSSKALLGALSKRSKTWLMPQQFRQGQDKPGEGPPPAEAKESVEVEKPKEEEGKVEKERETVESKPIVATEPDKNTRQTDQKKEEKKDVIPEKPSSEKGTLPLKPPATNGSSTPRSSREAAGRERPNSRMEVSKPPGPARKLSPPPRHQPPSNLPSRPDSTDPRNGNREPRGPPRLPPDQGRAPYPRDTRGYRGPEQAYDDYERSHRRHDRLDGPVHSSSRDERPPPRERESDRQHDRTRPPERDRVPERERPTAPSTRERETRDRTTRAAPSRPAPPEEASRPNSSAPTRPPSGPAETVGVNPERAALINNTVPSSNPNMSIRGQAQERNRPSRGSSPRREDERRGPSRNERDERPPSDRPPAARGPPTPASEAPSQRQSYGLQSSRDSRPNYPPVDMQKGRLEQDPAQRPPPRNDRPAPEADVPSGPRGRGMPAPRGRGGPTLNTQVTQNTERPTPTGPARHSRQNSHQDHSTPQTPDTTGVHPSRLNQISSPTDTQRPAPAIQASPPAGPRGIPPANAPSGPSPTTRAPPAGPQMNDGAGRGRSNRHLAAVNNTLSQAGQGTSARGRGGSRQNSANFNPHIPQAPTGPGARENFGPQQQDLFGGQNPNGMPVGPRPPSSRQENSRRQEEDPERRSSRRHEEQREHRNERDKDDRERRDNRPRRDEHDDRRDYRSGPPRDEPPSRKHGREGDGMQYPGGGGRGGSRTASESKRPRRGGP